jgi:hypothetical protein
MFEYRDIVTLIKKDGTIINNIAAIAQPKTICIRDKNVPVEEGDFLQRILPNGVVERKVITDTGYFGDHKNFSPYQCKVESVKKISTKSQNIYNINGNNSKVNINTVDNSTNNVTLTPENLFVELCSVIEEQIQDNIDIKNCLKELKFHHGKSSFLEKYQNFIATSASHMSIIAPFIPALTQMLK